MLYEKPNESLHWKNRLDDLDHLPGEQIPEKNSGWKKLHNRLQEKPRIKIIRWYLTAAACLLLIVGIPWLTINEKDNNLAKNRAQLKPGNSSITTIPSTGNTIISPLQTQTENKLSVTAKAKTKQQYQRVYKSIEIDKPVVNKSKVPISINSELYNISINPDTIAFVTAVPVKKKLRVVHINELNKLVEHSQFARSNTLPAFRIKSLNDDASSVFVVSRNSSDNIIKIKLPPSN